YSLLEHDEQNDYHCDDIGQRGYNQEATVVLLIHVSSRLMVRGSSIAALSWSWSSPRTVVMLATIPPRSFVTVLSCACSFCSSSILVSITSRSADRLRNWFVVASCR